MKESHHRKHSWPERWPLGSMTDAGLIVRRMGELVDEAAGNADVSVRVVYPDNERHASGIDEFAVAAANLPFDTMQELFLTVSSEATAHMLQVSVMCFELTGKPHTLMTVKGSRALAVDGVAVQLQRFLDEQFAAIEQRREAASHSAQVLVHPPDSNASPNVNAVAPDEAWYEGMWVITIIGGTIAAVVAGIILTLVL